MNVVQIGRWWTVLLLVVIASSPWRLIQAPCRVLCLSHERDMYRFIARTIHPGSESPSVCRGQSSVWRVVQHHGVKIVRRSVHWPALVAMSEIGIFCTP